MQRRIDGGYLVLPFLFFSILSFAQQNSVSPYSRLGLGEFNLPNYTRELSMGGASTANYDALFINPSNPASYSALDLTTFQIGMFSSFIEQSQEDPALTIDNTTAGLRYFAFGLPLTEWWGSAIGLQPYSSKGYDIGTVRTGPDDIEIVDEFKGNGGFNQLYWGNSFEIAKGLSIGANASYLFGTMTESQTVFWNASNVFISQFDNRLRASGFRFDYGAQYNLNLAGDKVLGLGVTFADASDLPVEVESYSYVIDPQQGPVDSLFTSSSRDDELVLPSELSGGIYFGQKSRRSPNRAWGVSFDYEIYTGSEFRTVDGRQTLEDGYKFQLGGHLTPALTWEQTARRGNYLGAIEYRLGGYFERTPLMLNGTAIDDYGITFGIGLPVRQRGLAPGEVKVSNVNLGLRMGRRGTLENNLIREEYLTLFIGVSLNDKWFIDYKYR